MYQAIKFIITWRIIINHKIVVVRKMNKKTVKRDCSCIILKVNIIKNKLKLFKTWLKHGYWNFPKISALPSFFPSSLSICFSICYSVFIAWMLWICNYIQAKPTNKNDSTAKGDDCCKESSVLHLTEQIIDTWWANVLVNLKVKSDGGIFIIQIIHWKTDDHPQFICSYNVWSIFTIIILKFQKKLEESFILPFSMNLLRSVLCNFFYLILMSILEKILY